MLIAGKSEKLILDHRPANGSTRGVTVQLRHLFVGGNVGVLIVEIGGSIQPIRTAVNVQIAVNDVGAGGGAHVDVRAAGGTLLRIVHGSVYAKFLNGFRGGRRQGLADRQIRRCRALNYFRGGAGRAGNASVVHNAC